MHKFKLKSKSKTGRPSENGRWYNFRIHPIVDALKYKIGYLFDQIKELKNKHQEEIEQLKSDLNTEHKADLEQAKAIAEDKKQKLLQKIS